MGFLRLVFIVFLFSSVRAKGIDFEQFTKQLTGEGATGWVHGSVAEANQYVFTYRTPGNFFDHAEFPLVTKDVRVTNELKKLNRHDQILVRGRFIDNSAPIHHILVENMSVVKKYEPAIEVPPYQHQAKLPESLVGKSELVGIVHAVAGEGHVVVVEYQDAIIPVPVEKNDLTKTFYRNDKIRLRFKLQGVPAHPTHLIPDPMVLEPFTVLERISDVHGKTGTVEGNLILFPKSPEIIFNVFAVQKIDSDGISRQFTLVNFDDPKVFAAIREKLQSLWDSSPGSIINARNKFLNPRLRIRATGVFNEVDPGQANPQILLAGPEAVSLVD